jgi:DNA-binding response OmpR family regulator
MSKRKVLIIEDDQVGAMAFARMLKSRDFDVVIAGDAIVAISAATRELPDLILLDLGLPGGNGFTVLKRLRALTSTCMTPIIVVTGGTVDQSKRSGLEEAGIDALLTKPVSEEVLLTAVWAAVGSDDSVELKEGTSPSLGA